MPDKAIDILDEAASMVRMKTFTIPDGLKNIQKEINYIKLIQNHGRKFLKEKQMMNYLLI